MEMNDRIKILRKDKLNMTQKNFAEKISLKQNSLALIEAGRPTSDRTIADICREFNVNEEWLRYGTGEIFEENPTETIAILTKEYNLDSIEQAILENFITADADERAQFLSFVKKMSGNKEHSIDENTIIFTDVTEEEKQLLTTHLKTIRSNKNVKNSFNTSDENISVYKVARSENHNPPEIMEISKEKVDTIENTKGLSKFDEL